METVVVELVKAPATRMRKGTVQPKVTLAGSVRLIWSRPGLPGERPA